MIFTLNRGEILVQTQEHFLGQILCHFAIAQSPQGDGENHSLVAVNQFAEAWQRTHLF
jgi:hypothetical protein